MKKICKHCVMWVKHVGPRGWRKLAGNCLEWNRVVSEDEGCDDFKSKKKTETKKKNKLW